MDESLAAILAMILASANLLLGIWCIARQGRRPLSVVLLFWLSSLYLVGIPLMVDAIAVSCGWGEAWSALLRSIDENYTYDIDGLILYRTAGFVLAFNTLFFLSYWRSRNYREGEELPLSVADASRPPKALILMPCAIGWMGLLIFIRLYGFDWEAQGFEYMASRDAPQSQDGIAVALLGICLVLSAAGIFYAIRARSFFWTVMTAIPSGSISLLTSQRPHVVPCLVCALYAFLYSAREVSLWRLLGKAAVGGLFLATVLSAIRTGIYHTEGELAAFLPYPVKRDSSVDMLYYCFSDNGAYEDPGTEFEGIKRLLLTGIRSRLVFGDSLTTTDVTAYLGATRFGWSDGTLHPTLYGWLFVDMKWYGLLFAVPLGFVLAKLERRSAADLPLRVMMVACLAMFIVVAMRGSVQFAYSRTIYSLGCGVALFVLGHMWHNAARRQRGRRESAANASSYLS